MGTRCNVMISQTGKTNKAVYVYRNYDGYPDGTLPSLLSVLAKVGKRADELQVATKIIQYNTTSGDTIDFPYELTSGEHGDIEYRYLINVRDRVLIVQSVKYSLDFLGDIEEPTYKEVATHDF